MHIQVEPPFWGLYGSMVRVPLGETRLGRLSENSKTPQSWLKFRTWSLFAQESIFENIGASHFQTNRHFWVECRLLQTRSGQVHWLWPGDLALSVGDRGTCHCQPTHELVWKQFWIYSSVSLDFVPASQRIIKWSLYIIYDIYIILYIIWYIYNIHIIYVYIYTYIYTLAVPNQFTKKNPHSRTVSHPMLDLGSACIITGKKKDLDWGLGPFTENIQGGGPNYVCWCITPLLQLVRYIYLKP